MTSRLQHHSTDYLGLRMWCNIHPVSITRAIVIWLKTISAERQKMKKLDRSQSTRRIIYREITAQAQKNNRRQIMSFSIVSRIVALAVFSYKLFTDASFSSNVQLYTGIPFSVSQTECSLIATLLLFTALMDLIPWLESNKKYFHSVPRVRLLVFVALHIVTAQHLVPLLDLQILMYYAMFEETTNLCILTENTLS